MAQVNNVHDALGKARLAIISSYMDGRKTKATDETSFVVRFVLTKYRVSIGWRRTYPCQSACGEVYLELEESGCLDEYMLRLLHH